MALFRREQAKAKEVGRVDTLFLGDSYLEFWNYDQFTSKTFYEIFHHALNLGLGGTTFENWLLYLPLIDKKLSPKRIIVNLGFNDIHSGATAKEVLSFFHQFHAILTRRYPKAQILYLTPIHCPVSFEAYFTKEKQYDNLFRRDCQQRKIAYLDSEKVFEERRKKEGPLAYKAYFWQDGMHPSEKGYDVFQSLIGK
jgi:lysophospholipase L1-like esterase